MLNSKLSIALVFHSQMNQLLDVSPEALVDARADVNIKDNEGGSLAAPPPPPPLCPPPAPSEGRSLLSIARERERQEC